MRLPFFKKKLNNQFSFSVTISRSKTSDIRYSLNRALNAAIANPETFQVDEVLTNTDLAQQISAFTRLTVSPQISHRFSNKVQASFNLRYEKFDSEDSRQPSATNIQGNFNIRVSIQN